MSKKISFRALDFNNKLIYSRDILTRWDWVSSNPPKENHRTFLQNGYSCNQMPQIGNFVEVKTETLQRCIGLTDINGNEIYEGDIIKCYEGYFNEGNEIEYGQYSDDIFEVKFDFGIFCLALYDRIGVPVKLEIIGNIHENPELLNYNE